MDDKTQDAMAKYFGSGKQSAEIASSIATPTAPQTDGAYTYQHEMDGTTPGSTEERADTDRRIFNADANIDDVDALAEEVRKLCNAAWGSEWGEFRSAFSNAKELSESEGQVITYDLLVRTITDNTSIKPKFMYDVKEMVNGKPTGDTLRVSLMKFDTIIEFNIWGENDLDARKLSRRFETLISNFIWRLKKSGVSEMIFYKEQPASMSDKFFPNKPMRSLLYNVRLDRYHVIRESALKEIRIQLETMDQQ